MGDGCCLSGFIGQMKEMTHDMSRNPNIYVEKKEWISLVTIQS